MAKKKAVAKKAAPGRAPRGLSQGEQAGAESSTTEETAPAGAAKKAKRDRPVRCIHRHTDVEFRRAFPKVCEGLLKKAAQGKVQETRLLLQMGKFGEPKSGKRRAAASLSAMLLEELKRRQDERELAAGVKDSSESTAATTAETANLGSTEGATSGDGEAR